MDAHQRPGTTLTTFDPRTARAVVAVLQRAGIQAWMGDAEGDGQSDEARVIVAEGRRDEALRALGARMEEVRQAAEDSDASEFRRRRPSPPTPGASSADPDDPRSGPPLVMERLRGLGWLAAVILVPLMVVALAPTLRGDVAIRVLIGIAVVVVGVIVFRRRR